MKYSAALVLIGTLTGTTAGIHPAAIQPGGLPSAVVHQVKLVQQGSQYRFEPSDLTVNSGDRVKFILVSGGPHNIAFDAEQISDDREAILARDMPDQIAPLASRILEDGESYTVALEGVKPGTYPYFCMPHVGMGMKGSITVQ